MLPFLSHWLGVSDFGLTLAVQSLALVGSLLVQYGFGVSAPRDLAQCRSDQEVVPIVARVLGAQIVTTLVACLVVGGAAMVTPMFGQSWVAVLSTVLLTLGTGLSPAWYFRGIGRAATGMGLELLGQVISFALVLILAYLHADVSAALMALAIGPVVSTLVALTWMFARLPLPPVPTLKDAGRSLRSGLPLFVVRASSTGFTSGSVWMVGLLSTAEQAAYFGVAAKLIGAITSLSQPITFTMLPEISRRVGSSSGGAVKAALKWGSVLVGIAVAAIVGVYLLGGFVIGLLFAPDMAPAVGLTQALSWVTVLVALRETQGDLILVPLRKDKLVAAIVVAGGALGVFSGMLWVPQGGAAGMVAARIAAEGLVVVAMAAALLYVRRLRPNSASTTHPGGDDV